MLAKPFSVGAFQPRTHYILQVVSADKGASRRDGSSEPACHYGVLHFYGLAFHILGNEMSLPDNVVERKNTEY